MPEIKLNIPFPLELDGVEYEATGEFREPRKGEVYVSDLGGAYLMDGYFAGYRIILRPVWQWPAWLTARWLAKDRAGGWFAYKDKPHISDGYWRGDEPFVQLNSDVQDFTPPPCSDWRDSLRENPNWENTTEGKR